MMVVGIAVALTLGMLAGWILRWRISVAQGTWVVKCGTCASERVAGPRRQLYVEVWDSYGTQYKQWRVGKWGEYRDTREPGPWLWDQIRNEVHRVGELTLGGGIALVRGDGTEPGAEGAP